MCGRYGLKEDPATIAERFEAPNPQVELLPNFNVAPGQIMPVITEDDKGRHIEMMKWGLIPVWAKDPKIGYKLINARSETAFEKPIWRSVIKRQRALIPASGFYEWKKLDDKQKQPYYIHPKHSDLFSFAGVWSTWRDSEGKEWKTYSIMTTEPNKEMRKVHDRMPVILHPEDEASWLDPKNNERGAVEPFLRPFEDNGLDMYEVSTDVNSVKNNNSHLMLPLNSK